MRFGITRLHPRASSFLEIPVEEFARAKECKRGFMALLDTEEKLDIVLENYAEYERELLSLALQRALFFDPTWSSVIADIHIVNRRLANLLTTARLYLDQVKHGIKKVYGLESAVTQALEERLKAEYSETLGYRVMEALRNYIQHRGLPVYRLDYPNKAAFSSSSDGGLNVRSIRWGISPSLNVAVLREDEKIKKSVLDELAGKGDCVPITPLVRQYVEAIGRFHESLRELTSTDLAEWKEQMGRAITLGREHFHEDLIGVSLVVEQDAGNYTEVEQVFEDLMKRHDFLAQKNLALKRISIQFVSGECIEGSDS